MTSEKGYASGADATAMVFLDSISDAAPLAVTDDDGHHLARVRRIEQGEHLVAADGTGAWRRCLVTELVDNKIILEPVGPITDEPVVEPHLAIAFAPAKSDTASTVVRQLVELGVDRIIPIMTKRGIVRWESDKGDKALVRLRKVVREAAMQSFRARLPSVESVIDISDLGGHPGIVIAELGGDSPSDLVHPPGGEWLVVVGPEGGLEADEVDELRAWGRMALGPHILRSKTAPIAAAAALSVFRR